MGQVFTKDYFPNGYIDWIAGTIDRLKYTNEEAKKAYKLEAIVKLDLQDMIRDYCFPNEKAPSQEDFDKLELDMRSMMDGTKEVPDVGDDNDVAAEKGNAAAIAIISLDSTQKFIDWFMEAITTDETGPFASLSSRLSHLNSKGTLACISIKFDDSFANEHSSEELSKFRTYIVDAMASYSTKFNAEDPSVILSHRRDLVVKRADANNMLVLAMHNHYKYQESIIRSKGQSGWISARKDLWDVTDRGVLLRAFYDTLVGAKIAEFWLLLSKQPIDSIVSYFDEHRLKDIDAIFFAVQKEFNISEGPELIIATYKRLCC